MGKGGLVITKEVKLYLGVAGGVAARPIYDALINSTSVAWPLVLAGIIASVLIFPGVYDKGELNRGPLTWAKWCIAFQNGFFWQSLVETIAKSYKPS
jgi:hypothetical protein